MKAINLDDSTPSLLDESKETYSDLLAQYRSYITMACEAMTAHHLFITNPQPIELFFHLGNPKRKGATINEALDIIKFTFRRFPTIPMKGSYYAKSEKLTVTTNLIDGSRVINVLKRNPEAETSLMNKHELEPEITIVAYVNHSGESQPSKMITLETSTQLLRPQLPKIKQTPYNQTNSPMPPMSTEASPSHQGQDERSLLSSYKQIFVNHLFQTSLSTNRKRTKSLTDIRNEVSSQKRPFIF